MKIIGWFSGGATSAVAIKKVIDAGHDVVIYYFETGAHHPDHERFLKDCEKWYGRPINVIRNKKAGDLYQVLNRGYINSAHGAYCTKLLKKDMRIMLEKILDYDYQIFGFEYAKKEVNRALSFYREYPEAKPIFPLIELKMNKTDALREIMNAGIELPAMYKLGYSNSNCIGCVKGGKGYWNRIRKDFPDAFKRMAEIERRVGATCLKETVNGKGKKLYLDELDPEAGRDESISLPECGVTCEVEFVGNKEIDVAFEEIKNRIF